MQMLESLKILQLQKVLQFFSTLDLQLQHLHLTKFKFKKIGSNNKLLQISKFLKLLQLIPIPHLTQVAQHWQITKI